MTKIFKIKKNPKPFAFIKKNEVILVQDPAYKAMSLKAGDL